VLFVKNYLHFAVGEDYDEQVEDAMKDLAERKKRTLAKRKLQLENAKTSDIRG